MNIKLDFPRVWELRNRKLFKKLLQTEVSELIVPTENNGRVSSRRNDLLYLRSNSPEYRINPKVVRLLTGTEKLKFYTIIRIGYLLGQKRLGLVLDDLTSLFNSRLSKEMKEYFYLSALDDKKFLEEIEARLNPNNPTRRDFFRYINSKVLIGKELVDPYQVIIEYFRLELYVQKKKKKRRKVFRKGHNDHGSLGNTDQKLLKAEGEYVYKHEVLIEEKERDVIHEVRALLGGIVTEKEQERLKRKL